MDLCPQPQQCSLWIQLNISLEGQLGIIRQGQDNEDMKDIPIITTIITIKVIKISNNGTCRQVAGKRRSCQVHTGRSPRPEADAPDGLFTPQVSFLELDKGAHKKRTLVVAQFYSRDNKHKHKTSCAALSGLCTIFLVATKL